MSSTSKNGYKSLLFYVSIILIFTILIYLTIKSGKTLEIHKMLVVKTDNGSASIIDHLWETLHNNLTHPIAILLLQIITIIFTARTLGFLFNMIGQPTVIGEILAGIILGPSLLGMWFPEYSDFLFPKTSLGNLQLFSQVGLILFMFVIGMELDLNVLKNKAKDAIIVSHIGIIIPYAFGIGLAYYLYTDFAPD